MEQANLMQRRVTLLRKTAIFASLPADELLVIAGLSESIELNAGETVFEEGTPGDALFIIEEGEVTISRQSEGFEQIDLARLLAQDIFGELESLSCSPRTARASAATHTLLLRFPRNGMKFEDILKGYPSISAKILQNFLVIIAGRIRNTNNLIKENSPVIQELKNQVYRDKLTGLYNKTFLEEHIRDLLHNEGASVALLMIKPDNYKFINDTYGHEAGDHTLQIMARELQAELEGNGLAVRFMGNELCAVLPDRNREESLSFARKIQNRMNRLDLSPVIGEREFSLSVSIGIAVYPDPAFPEEPPSGERLIERAHELPLIGRARGGNMILFPEDKEVH